MVIPAGDPPNGAPMAVPASVADVAGVAVVLSATETGVVPIEPPEKLMVSPAEISAGLSS